MKSYYVYITSNIHRKVLYIGVTNDLHLRIQQHKTGEGSAFTSKYKCHVLLYFEEFKNINEAIAREKQLKNWHREWKINLVKSQNPELSDLASDW